jgi:hypothetical protein
MAILQTGITNLGDAMANVAKATVPVRRSMTEIAEVIRRLEWSANDAYENGLTSLGQSRLRNRIIMDRRRERTEYLKEVQNYSGKKITPDFTDLAYEEN